MDSNEKRATGQHHDRAKSKPEREEAPADGSRSAQDQAAAAEIEQLQQELEKVRAQSAENFDGWQRERADFVNYRKRIERDQAQTLQNMTGNIAKRFLPVVDDLERALKNKPQSDSASWADGIELILRKLINSLEAEGVKRMEADGQIFDPSMHEAISHEDSPNHESGQIIEVVQQGYMIGDRVLRPALVRVAR